MAREDFLALLTDYNLALWPAREALSLAAFGAVCLVLFPGPARDRAACAILAGLWAWAGLIFAFGFLAGISPVGWLFGGLFALQAVFFLHMGVLRHDVRFWMHTGSRHLAGILLVFYALVAYPSLAALLGRVYPATPSFGLPTPVTLFTLGMLLLTRAPWPRLLFAVPLFWTVIGTWMALELRLREDLALLMAAALVLTMSPTEDDPDAAQATH